MRPGSPAPGQANTVCSRLPVGSTRGAVHVVPLSLEVAKYRRVLPVTAPGEPGACSQTANSPPRLSTAIVGKFAPVTEPGKLATRWSAQLVRPVGLVSDSAPMSQRTTEMSLSAALS